MTITLRHRFPFICQADNALVFERCVWQMALFLPSFINVERLRLSLLPLTQHEASTFNGQSPLSRCIRTTFLTGTRHTTAIDMANTTSGFLVLPTELRLKVYQMLLKECLASGWVSAIAGLFLCCRDVHHELEAEFMARIRLLLTAKYKWGIYRDKEEPLRLLIKPTLSRNMFKPELSIDLDFVFDLIRDKEGLEDLLHCLRPVLASSWSVLTLNIDHWFLILANGEKTSLFRTFFDALDYRKRVTTQGFQHVDRLVLNIGKPSMRVSQMPLRTLIRTYLHTRNYFANLHQPRFIIQAWISRVSNGDMPGWLLALDLNDGLNPVSDGLWRLGEAGGSLTVDRLFDSMDHIHANDDYESLWKHPIAHFKLSAYFNKLSLITKKKSAAKKRRTTKRMEVRNPMRRVMTVTVVKTRQTYQRTLALCVAIRVVTMQTVRSITIQYSSDGWQSKRDGSLSGRGVSVSTRWPHVTLFSQTRQYSYI
jgi:hypothetical protein